MHYLADVMEAKKDKRDTKEDFMILHLRPPCASCRRYLAGEKYYGLEAGASGSSAAKAVKNFDGIQLQSE